MEIELVSTLKMISQVYEEISVMKMQRIRDSVLKTRMYLSRMSDVYYDVKSAYRESLFDKITGKKKRLEGLSKVNKNGKTIAVLVSANSKMNGDILKKVFRNFQTYLKKHPDVDVAIVGKIGKGLYEERNIERPYDFFEMSEKQLDLESVKKLILHIMEYKEAVMFYGEFESLLNQNPVHNNVSGNEVSEGEKEQKREDKGFIFEPSIDKILEFFEKQYFSSMVKQNMYEAELARYASRITAMEQAIQHVNESEKSLKRQERKLIKGKQNKMQMDTVTGLMFLKR